MELCDFNLETYAQTLWSQAPWEAMLKPDKRSIVDINMRIKQIWTIMKEIACGVLFIHLEGEVHRDLKPQNSSFTD
jgi:serine/threonine protein kinase